MNNDDFTLLVSGGSRHPLSKHVYCVAVAFKITKLLEQQICIKFCVKLEHSSEETIWMTQLGQLVIGSFITTTRPLIHHVSCRVFWWNIKSPRWLGPTTAQIQHPATSGFSQNSNHLRKGRDFRSLMRFQENITGQVMANGRTVWGPKVPTLKQTGVSLSYIQCFLYLVSSSVTVSVFHITWLDTFLSDFVFIFDSDRP